MLLLLTLLAAVFARSDVEKSFHRLAVKTGQDGADMMASASMLMRRRVSMTLTEYATLIAKKKAERRAKLKAWYAKKSRSEKGMIWDWSSARMKRRARYRAWLKARQARTDAWLAKSMMKKCSKTLMEKKICTTKEACKIDCEARIKQMHVSYQEWKDDLKPVKKCKKEKCLSGASSGATVCWLLAPGAKRRGCYIANGACKSKCNKLKTMSALRKFRDKRSKQKAMLRPAMLKCIQKCPKWKWKTTLEERKKRWKCRRACQDARNKAVADAAAKFALPWMWNAGTN